MATSAAGHAADLAEVTAVATSLVAAWAVAEVLEALAVVEADNSTSPMFVPSAKIFLAKVELTLNLQLPFNVGWQDLKDLFRQAGMSSPNDLSN